MELDLQRQALGLLEAWILGVGLGLGYDVLRPPRRRLGQIAGAALDVLFSLLAAAACFVASMRADSGRMGLWELTASLLGFLLYLHVLSPLILPILAAGMDFLCSIIVSLKKFSVKCQVSAKKIFQKVRKCFIVKR